MKRDLPVIGSQGTVYMTFLMESPFDNASKTFKIPVRIKFDFGIQFTFFFDYFNFWNVEGHLENLLE